MGVVEILSLYNVSWSWPQRHRETKGRVEMLFSAAEAACPRREAVKDVGWEGRQLTVSVTRLKVQGWAWWEAGRKEDVLIMKWERVLMLAILGTGWWDCSYSLKFNLKIKMSEKRTITFIIFQTNFKWIFKWTKQNIKISEVIQHSFSGNTYRIAEQKEVN